MTVRWETQTWYTRPRPGRWYTIPDGCWGIDDLAMAKGQAQRLADDGERTRVIDTATGRVVASYGRVP